MKCDSRLGLALGLMLGLTEGRVNLILQLLMSIRPYANLPGECRHAVPL